MENPTICELQSWSNLHALQLIYAGFKALCDAEVIDLEQRVIKEKLIDSSQPVHLQDARKHHLKLTLNNQFVLYYDLHDSYEIDQKALEKSGLYFKRSYSENYLRSIGIFVDTPRDESTGILGSTKSLAHAGSHQHE